MMRVAEKLILFSLALCFIPAVSGSGADSRSVDQLQIDTFGTSTLQGVKEIYLDGKKQDSNIFKG